MKQFIEKLRVSNSFERVTKILLYVFLSLYSFSLPAFSGRLYFNYISYFFVASLLIIVFLYCFLFLRPTLFKPLLFISFFVIWAFVGTCLYSHEFRYWLGLVLMSVTLFLLFYAYQIIGDLRKTMQLILLGMLGFSVYFIIHYRGDILNFDSISYFRLGDFFDNVNSIGSYCSFSIMIILYLSLFGKRKLCLLYLFAIIPFLIVGFSTGSREFILDLILYILILLFFRLKDKMWLYFIVIGILAISVVGIMNLPFMSTLSKRLISAITNIFGTSTSLDTSLYQRVLWQEYGYYLGSTNIITGYGIGGFAIYSGIGTYTHGNYSELIADFGIIGFASFYLLPIYCFVKAIQTKNEEKYFVISIFIVLCVINGFTDIYFSKKTTYLLFALISYCSTIFVPNIAKRNNCELCVIEI